MLATLSPADIHFEETLTTLRFAERARSIKNKVVKVESPADRVLTLLQEDKARLGASAAGGLTLSVFVSTCERVCVSVCARAYVLCGIDSCTFS
jgi:hypothetical protein